VEIAVVYRQRGPHRRRGRWLRYRGARRDDSAGRTHRPRRPGVSNHYAPAEKFARPSETLTGRLTQALTAGRTAPQSGLAWTIDAPYRETVAEARSYQAEGVVCVEMEAAALFTVGQYRSVDVAAAFVISDHLLAEDRWTHAFGTPTLRQASIRLLDAALHALGRHEPPRP
jgi:uridine phosphorylase